MRSRAAVPAIIAGVVILFLLSRAARAEARAGCLPPSIAATGTPSPADPARAGPLRALPPQLLPDGRLAAGIARVEDGAG